MALAVLSGTLLTLSFPKAGYFILAWIAFIPLLFSIRNHSIKYSFRLGMTTGFFHYTTLLYWLVYTLKMYGYLPVYTSVCILLLLASYLSLYIGLFSALLSRLAKKPLSILLISPALFVTLEYIRSYFLSGFPWGLLGYSQYKNLLLIQFSDITGVLGVSFLIVLSNSAFFLIFLFFTGKKWQGQSIKKSDAIFSMGIFLFLICLAGGYGAMRMQTIKSIEELSPQAVMTAIQGNVDQSVKWDHAFQYSSTLKHLKLSQQAMTDHPDLIIWPETSAPFYFNHDIGLTKMALRRIRETGAHFLIGCPSFRNTENNFEYLNSAVIITPKGEISDQYNKVHLVPYGEYVPFKEWLPFLGKMVAQAGDFVPGTKGQTISWNSHAIGAQICFEIIFPNLSRSTVENGVEIIINITNDAWFGKTSAPYQHFAMTVFRAIENRRALVRAANTGISGFISPTGQILDTTALYQEAVLTRRVPLLHIKSFYTRHGGHLTYIYLAIVAALVLYLLRINNEVATPKQDT